MIVQSVQDRGDGGAFTHQLPPVVNGPIRGQQRAGQLMAPHDDFQRFLVRGWRQLAHPEVVNDQEGDCRQILHKGLMCAIDGGFGNVVESRMGFAIEDAVSLRYHRQSDGLGQIALAGAGGSEKQGDFVSGDETDGGQIEGQTAIYLRVECKVEGVSWSRQAKDW